MPDNGDAPYRRSKNDYYLHLVWTTKGRQPLLTPDVEREVHRCIRSLAEESECRVMALNGTADHVHLIIQMTRKKALMDVMKVVKATSSAFVNDVKGQRHWFRWQESYGVFCVCRNHLSEAIAYVDNQKRHHAEGTLNPEWEEVDEEINNP